VATNKILLSDDFRGKLDCGVQLGQIAEQNLSLELSCSEIGELNPMQEPEQEVPGVLIWLSGRNVALLESNSDNDKHVDIDKGNIDKGNGKGNNNADNTDSELDLDTRLSDLA
jgi:hypothetical protein